MNMHAKWKMALCLLAGAMGVQAAAAAPPAAGNYTIQLHDKPKGQHYTKADTECLMVADLVDDPNVGAVYHHVNADNKVLLTQSICDATKFDGWDDPGARQFTLKPSGDYFRIVNRYSGKCLDVPEETLDEENGMIQQYECSDDNPNQDWTLVAVPGAEGWYGIVSRASGKALASPFNDATDLHGAERQKIRQRKPAASTAQQFRFLPVK